jgi:hypothetical protein
VLSDHNAQIIELNNFNIQEQYNETEIIRNFNKHTIIDFKIKLSFETLDDSFEGNDMNAIFNNFLDTFIRIYYSSFTKNKIQCKPKDNNNRYKDFML